MLPIRMTRARFYITIWKATYQKPRTVWRHDASFMMDYRADAVCGNRVFSSPHKQGRYGLTGFRTQDCTLGGSRTLTELRPTCFAAPGL